MRKQMKKMIETLGRGFGWAWNRKVRVGVLLLVSTILLPGPAKAFLDPCCALMAAGLTSISSALSSVIGGGLNSILGVEQDIQKFDQTVVWPQNLINQARSLVGNVRNIFVQIQTITQVPVNSATLAGPQQLETKPSRAQPLTNRPDKRAVSGSLWSRSNSDRRITRGTR